MKQSNIKQTITEQKSYTIFSSCVICGDEWHDVVNRIPTKVIGDKTGNPCLADGHTCLGDRVINRIKVNTISLTNKTIVGETQ